MNDLKTLTILFRAKDALEKAIQKDVGHYGLNVTEFGVLEALYHLGDISIKMIMKKVLIKNSSLSYVIEQLEKKNYLIKTQSSEDKRSYILSLTKAGKDLMNKVYVEHLKNMRKILDKLDETEELNLQKSLKKIGKTASYYDK
ncbi:MAG: MarR family transcriptional regulator [Candidatus Izimaplasma sp.]|nr:MarR family transcriptional regulator [Candidatus Izimaplasma bacterium]